MHSPCVLIVKVELFATSHLFAAATTRSAEAVLLERASCQQQKAAEQQRKRERFCISGQFHPTLEVSPSMHSTRRFKEKNIC